MKLWHLIVIAILLFLLMAKRATTEIIMKMAEAIKTYEGWHEGSCSYRNNNPGNLKYAGQPGAIGEDALGHAIFDSYASGWSALVRQLEAAFYGRSSVYFPYDTLNTFFRKYAESNQAQYAEYVANELGVSSNTQLRNLA